MLCPSPLVSFDSLSHTTIVVYENCAIPCPYFTYSRDEWSIIHNTVEYLAYSSFALSFLVFIAHYSNKHAFYIRQMFIGGFMGNSFFIGLFMFFNYQDQLVCVGDSHFVEKNPICVLQAAATIFFFMWTEVWSTILAYDTYLHVCSLIRTKDIPILHRRYTVIAVSLSLLVTAIPFFSGNLGFDPQANIPMCMFLLSKSTLYFWFTFFAPFYVLLMLSLIITVIGACRIHQIFVSSRRYMVNLRRYFSHSDVGSPWKMVPSSPLQRSIEDATQDDMISPLVSTIQRALQTHEVYMVDNDVSDPLLSEYSINARLTLGHIGDLDVESEPFISSPVKKDNSSDYCPPRMTVPAAAISSITTPSTSKRRRSSSIDAATFRPHSTSSASSLGNRKSRSSSNAIDDIDLNYRSYVESVRKQQIVTTEYHYPGLYEKDDPLFEFRESQQDQIPDYNDLDINDSVSVGSNELIAHDLENQRLTTTRGTLTGRTSEGVRTRGSTWELSSRGSSVLSNVWKYNGRSIVFVIVFCLITLGVAPFTLDLYYFRYQEFIDSSDNFATCLIHSAIQTQSLYANASQELVDNLAHEACGELPSTRPNLWELMCILIFSAAFGIMPSIVFFGGLLEMLKNWFSSIFFCKFWMTSTSHSELQLDTA